MFFFEFVNKKNKIETLKAYLRINMKNVLVKWLELHDNLLSVWHIHDVHILWSREMSLNHNHHQQQQQSWLSGRAQNSQAVDQSSSLKQH